jgi:hypothetical protein
MFVADWLTSLVFGSLYGALVTGIALLAAIPYGIWEGLRWLRQQLTGGNHGDA